MLQRAERSIIWQSWSVNEGKAGGQKVRAGERTVTTDRPPSFTHNRQRHQRSDTAWRWSDERSGACRRGSRWLGGARHRGGCSRADRAVGCRVRGTLGKILYLWVHIFSWHSVVNTPLFFYYLVASVTICTSLRAEISPTFLRARPPEEIPNPKDSFHSSDYLIF